MSIEQLEKVARERDPEGVERLLPIFTYHPPKAEQLEAYQELRRAAYEFALTVIVHTPRSADQSAAIRKIREAVMTANAAVALEGKS